MRKGVQNQQGFSLVELIAVIAIIGIVAAVANSNWSKYTTNANLRNAARDVASDFFVTREKAVAESVNYRITFNVPGNSYTVTNLATGVTQTKTTTAFGQDIALQSVSFGGNVDFQSRGTVTNGNLVLVNGRLSKATLRVNITGRTYVGFEMQ